jgi:hypothetical protein
MPPRSLVHNGATLLHIPSPEANNLSTVSGQTDIGNNGPCATNSVQCKGKCAYLTWWQKIPCCLRSYLSDRNEQPGSVESCSTYMPSSTRYLTVLALVTAFVHMHVLARARTLRVGVLARA